MSEKFLFREVINKDTVLKIGSDIKQVYPKFDNTEFSEIINSQIESLNFGDRSKLVAINLKRFLPDSYQKAVEILLKSFGKEIQEEELTGFECFYYLPASEFVAQNGVEEEYFEISMNILYEITKRFTSESAIRPFIIKFKDKTLKQLHIWALDKNPHVRRLVSEGTRSRLPLSGRIKDFQREPKPVIELLEKLKDAPELYVRRSVANNFNDISKDNPGIVIETLKKWNLTKNAHTEYIIKHALRTLIKSGDKEALKLLNYKSSENITVENFKLSKNNLYIGQDFEFSFDIISQNAENQNLMIDYIIHFMKANGKMSPKVFKLSKKRINFGAKLNIIKKHSFKEISTRKYYTGEHKIELQINGKKFMSENFFLEKN